MSYIDTTPLPPITVSKRKDHRVAAGVRLPPETMARLDRLCELDPLKPTRSRYIELAIVEFIQRREQQQQS